MRNTFVRICGALVLLVCVCEAAKADTMFTYYMIDSDGSPRGYVQFTTALTPPSAGPFVCGTIAVVNQPYCPLTSMNFYSFSSPTPTFTESQGIVHIVEFDSGILTNLEYHASGSAGRSYYYDFSTGGLTYYYQYCSGRTTGDPMYQCTNFNGVFSETPAGTVAAAPEPSSVALLGTGLLGVAGLTRQRRQPKARYVLSTR